MQSALLDRACLRIFLLLTKLSSKEPKMRSVVFVEKIELDFSGNIFANALALGDVDNDSLHELLVGSVDGDLWIYKGDNTVPIATASNLGMIVCTEIADVCNSNKNVAVVLCAEGLFYLFSVDKEEKKEAETAQDVADKVGAPDTSTERAEASSSSALLKSRRIRAFHTQHMPANAKVLLVADIDDDGELELVIGYTDRMVQAYRWQDRAVLPEDGDVSAERGFVLLQKWYLEGQVGSLSLSKNQDGSPKLVVSQPGCNYAELKCSWVQHRRTESPNPGKQGVGESTVLMHPITSLRARHSNVSTEIVAGLSKGGKEGHGDMDSAGDRIAMCTLDGTLMLIENDKSLWSRLVDHQLFALTKLDIMCDGWDEVVACAWDGQTYIIDHTQQSIRFHLKESVCAFAAGLYSTNGKNTPCLVYATFNNKIYIFWNVKLPRIPSANLLQVATANSELTEKLESLGINSEREKRELFRRLIYGKRKESAEGEKVS